MEDGTPYPVFLAGKLRSVAVGGRFQNSTTAVRLAERPGASTQRASGLAK